MLGHGHLRAGLMSGAARPATGYAFQCIQRWADGCGEALLLTRLNAFERYSQECESTNVADASIHAMLYSASGHCREFLEEVLRRLMAHEGIHEPGA